ncbi:MAG: biopolymer transporter ExbD [Chitinophagaceae bacterium]|nr:biopolymer transporter ExbD [Chitinophagaceae bacterium]MCW5905327.1 biopolymer transporter ExbD [Chitinophagaceae bacterium]
MNIRKRLREKPEVHTSALNDILFILLLFFLIVSTLANPNVVKVNNPKGKSDTKAKQNIVVSIDKENKIFLGQSEVPEFALDSVIQVEVDKVKAFIDTPSVVINADTISYTGGFFKVMSAAKKAGAKIVANVKD